MLTLIAAASILPRQHQQFLGLIKHAIFPIEAFITAYLIFKVTQIIKEYKLSSFLLIPSETLFFI
ncbi:MAG: hypothetical protein JSV88_00410 [Candidatus Aminicenantes bacterium]|nr:MAG: hypothetical protein JSV88_00410 [Candidatus Aminicenantes bacterium]